MCVCRANIITDQYFKILKIKARERISFLLLCPCWFSDWRGWLFWQYSEAQSAKKDKSSVESQLTTLQNQIAESSKSSESKVADDTEVPAANQPT